MNVHRTGLRILRPRETVTRTGYSRATLYRKVADGTFPKPVKLGPGAVGWVEAEIDEWISARIAERDSTERAA